MATITYNANGGYNAPAAQTFTGFTTITKSKPSRSGYEFLGWARTSTATSVTYAPGATYTGDSITLYAVWQRITYRITYDANGGQNPPATQTKNWGDYNFYLSSQIPTRNGYTFKGWAIKASTTAISYMPGDQYIGNANLTLFAVWSYNQFSLSLAIEVNRCNSSGTLTENGTYALVTGNYIADEGLDRIRIRYRRNASSSYTTARTITTGGTSGSIREIIGGSFGIEDSYEILVEISDDAGKTFSVSKNLDTLTYVLDFYAGGEGLTVGGAATSSGFNVVWPSTFSNRIDFEEPIYIHGTSSFNDTVSMSNAKEVSLPPVISIRSVPFIEDLNGDRDPSLTVAPLPVFCDNVRVKNGNYIQLGNTSSSFHNFMRMNTNNQFEMTWTSSYPMMGDMGTELWSGYWSPSSISRTISGASKYRMFLINLAGSSVADADAENGTWIVASRAYATYSTYRVAGGQNVADGNGADSMYYVGVYFQATNNSWILRSSGQVGLKTNGGTAWSSTTQTNFTHLGVTRIIGLI